MDVKYIYTEHTFAKNVSKMLDNSLETHCIPLQLFQLAKMHYTVPRSKQWFPIYRNRKHLEF